MDWIMILTLGAVLLILAFMFGYSRGLNDLKTIEDWGIGFDEGWECGWDRGFDSGYMCGITENRKAREALKGQTKEEA